MGDFSEFSLSVRLFLAAYRWRRIDPVPCAVMRKPLAESKIAIVTSAALTLPSQPPFDDGVRGGDWSLREIPGDADVASLVESHRSETFDHRGLHDDPNLGLPLDRLRELAAEGRIGSVAERHFSVMGSITAPGRLVRDTAPEIARRLAADGVDAVLLVPV